MNTAYPLFPVTLITILAFFTTWLFSKWDIIAVKSHRKFWNYLLLISFLISGLLGMLSVVKVNYKLEIRSYETLMQWHVAFGIGMVIISFFHLSWHLRYYFTFQKKASYENPKPAKIKGEKSEKPLDYAQGDGQTERSRSLILSNHRHLDNKSEKFRILLILLGVVAIISQVVFIREFINVLSGNELITGIVMAGWMLLSGWGAFAGRHGNFSRITLKRGISMLTVLSAIPVLLTFILYWAKNLLFPPGTIINLAASVCAVFLLLFPVCFLSGWLFTAFSTLYSESENKNLAGKAYALESLGSLLGGLIFSLILGRFFNSMQVFGLTSGAVLITGALLIYPENRMQSIRFLIPAITIPALIFVFNPDNLVKKMLFPNQEMLVNKSTHYGNLVVTRQAGQLNVYENSDLQFYTENMMINEEAVHFAMVQHKNPQRVLLVSGGISGMIKEIEKYNIEKITYLEINPEILKSLNQFDSTVLKSDKVEIIKSDIRNFISKSNKTYDVILLNLPPPSSLGLNRFYTSEFFGILKKSCTGETVICTSLRSTANYAGENELEVNSSLWKTLRVYFKNTLVLTGEKNYFLASGQPLTTAVSEEITNKNIATGYVNQFYLDDTLLAARSRTITEQFNTDTKINRDFYPYMFYKQTGHWLSHFGTNYKLIILIPLVLFLLIFVKLNKITAGLYTGGFTAASLEVALMLAYQVYFGSLYLATAFFFAVFMAGLATGSSFILKPGFPALKSYFMLQFGLAGFAIILPFLIMLTGEFSGLKLLSQTLFFVFVFVLSSAIGFEFLLASKLQEKTFSETSGKNYSIDLAGSAFGAFLAAVVLLPLLGLVYTCFLVAALNILSGTMAFSNQK